MTIALLIDNKVPLGFHEGLGRYWPQDATYLVLISFILVLGSLSLRYGLSCAGDGLVEAVLPFHCRLLPLVTLIERVLWHRLFDFFCLRSGSSISSSWVLSLGPGLRHGQVGGVAHVEAASLRSLHRRLRISHPGILVAFHLVPTFGDELAAHVDPAISRYLLRAPILEEWLVLAIMESFDRDRTRVAHLFALLLVFNNQGLAKLEQRAARIVAEVKLI